LAGALRQSHLRLTALFGRSPAARQTVYLLDRQAYETSTGLPAWTNAASQGGVIYIAVGADSPESPAKLRRSLRHEYLHAAVNRLSAGRCPGWLDEGLAQWFEGQGAAAPAAILRSWSARHPPIPLVQMQRGFTRMEEERAKAAYAQSLLAVKDLMRTYGISAFRRYFAALRTGQAADEAFARSFGIPLDGFERRLRIKISRGGGF